MPFDLGKAEKAYRADKETLNAVPSRAMTHDNVMDVTSEASVGVRDVERLSEAPVILEDNERNNTFIAARCDAFCDSRSNLEDCYTKCYGDDEVRVTQTCEQARSSWADTDFLGDFDCEGRTGTLVLLGQAPEKSASGRLAVTDQREYTTWNQETVIEYATEQGLCDKYDPGANHPTGFTFEDLGMGCGDEADANGHCNLGIENKNFSVLCPLAGVKVTANGTTRVSDLPDKSLTQDLCENEIGGVWKSNKCVVTKYKHAMEQVKVLPDGTTKRLDGMVCPEDYERCRGVDIVCPRLLNATNMLEEVPDLNSVGSQDTGPWFSLTNGHNEDATKYEIELNRPFSSVDEPLRATKPETWGASFVMRCWEKI